MRNGTAWMLGSIPPPLEKAACGHPTFVLDTLGNRAYRCRIDGEETHYEGRSRFMGATDCRHPDVFLIEGTCSLCGRKP